MIYAIANEKNELASARDEVNDGRDCVDIRYELDFTTYDPIWTTRSLATAERALVNDEVPWYNAGYDTPMHSDVFRKAKKRIVQLVIAEISEVSK